MHLPDQQTSLSEDTSKAKEPQKRLFTLLVPPTGFEPMLPAPEADALSS